MFRALLYLVASVGFSLACGAAAAHEPPKDKSKQSDPQIDFGQRFAVPPTVSEEVGKPAAPTVVAAPVTGVYVVTDETNPGKIIVLDTNGKWLPTVREIRQETTLITGQNPTVVCVMYEGTYRPTQPSVKTWQLMQSKTVTSHEFQRLVDDLQTNPDALKSTIKR